MTALFTPASTSNASHDHMIRYPRFLALHRDIRTCQELSQMTGEAHCMSLEGPPGAGKTTLV
jgi:tRNA A37 threonylcarbamoyladenosine biosynthesis protein TsaE